MLPEDRTNLLTRLMHEFRSNKAATLEESLTTAEEIISEQSIDIERKDATIKDLIRVLVSVRNDRDIYIKQILANKRKLIISNILSLLLGSILALFLV